ncbi:MAG: thioredoxin [Dehalococcoidia bacterium]|nr:MAG: thioredoxin [Dehalococcoidia bacterium]
MEQGFQERSQASESVTYDLTLPEGQAAGGVTRVLTRNGKKLEVKVPDEIRSGQTLRLRNALKLTDGRDGDILVRVRIGDGSEGAVEAVTDSTFEAQVLKAPLPVLVDFWAPWCGPCRTLSPVVERLATVYGARVRFCKLNVDENPLASRKYQVMSVPTILLFKHGQIAGMSVGAVSEGELRTRIESVLSGK